MTADHRPPSAADDRWPGFIQRLGRVRDDLQDEILLAGEPRLAEVLGDLPVAGGPRTVRVVVAGETKRGKSTLVNTLVGRPLLSPVGVDVTTACWLEFTYGDTDEAVVLVADPEALGAPRRIPIELRELERYAALQEISDPVLGVEVRLRTPLLRDLILVDTPGVGGLLAGHSRTTLAALKRADALLFVCDATQPILAPEVDFLIEAATRVPTIVIAATKRDMNPDFEVVVAQTRSRVSEQPSLRTVPVFTVAATLADRAADVEDETVAAQLVELSGMAPLVATLIRQAAIGGEGLRLAKTARTCGDVARRLAARAEETVVEPAGDPNREQALQGDIDRLAGLLDNRAQRSLMVQHHLTGLRVEPLDSFAAATSELRASYRTEAERGPAAQLNTLAPRMVADLTAAGVQTLEVAAEQATQRIRELLDQAGAGELVAEIPMSDPKTLDFDLETPRLPDRSPAGPDMATAAQVFSTLMQLMAGSAAVVAVLTGPGVVAASIALAAGVGWWRLRGNDEQQRRARLREWVDAAAGDARSGFDREMARRTLAVERYIDAVLPELLAGRQRDLSRLRSELAGLRRASEQASRAAVARQRELVDRLRGMARESDELALAFLGPRGAS